MTRGLGQNLSMPEKLEADTAEIVAVSVKSAILFIKFVL